ncbi:MAG: hypothetical protein IJJ26_00665 [Victivallales bacterium]|nr:hypothetical protein [Victivallales bacterium]
MEQLKDKCLTHEELEEYSRAKTGVRDVWRSHVEQCPHCQKVLEEIRSVNAAMVRLFTPPEGLVARVQNAVHSGRPERIPETAPRVWGPILWKVGVAAAACLVLVAVLRTGRTPTPVPETTPATVAQTTPEQPQPAVKPELKETPAVPSRPSPEETAVAKSTTAPVPLRGVRLVGMQHSQEQSPAQRRQGQFHLPMQIRHVWTMKTIAEGRAELAKLLTSPEEMNKIPLECKSFLLVLPDNAVQKLTDEFSARGWSLLSPDFPQPGKSQQIAFDGHPVEYYITIEAEE